MSVVRELLLGPKRFTELQRDVPGIGPTTLTRRLHGLLDSGVVQRLPAIDATSAGAYELTPWGHELEAVNAALAGWGAKSPGLPVDADMSPDTIVLAMRAHARPDPPIEGHEFDGPESEGHGLEGPETVLLRICAAADDPTIRASYRATLSADGITVDKTTDTEPADHDAVVTTTTESLKAVIIGHSAPADVPDFTLSGRADAVERLIAATRLGPP